MEDLSEGGGEGDGGEGETDGYLMWKAYGKSLFRKRNSIEVGEYFIQREKKIRGYLYIRRVVGNINRYSEVINLIELEKKTKARRVERFNLKSKRLPGWKFANGGECYTFSPFTFVSLLTRLLINFHYR